MVCKGDVSPGTFSDFQSINLCYLKKLLYGLPLVPRNVNVISVYFCPLLKFIFMEDEESRLTELPSLKILKLSDVPCLLSLVGPKQFSNTYEALHGAQIFFDGKIVFPSLELLLLKCCNNVVKLWSNEINKPGFQNLKDIEIELCENMSSVGSPSIFSILVQLETLRIRKCKEMRQVIIVEEIEESDLTNQVIRFPQLKYLELESLHNLESFYGGGSKLEFPKLKKLILDGLSSMKRFAKLESSSALFHEKIDFPCLEELRVISGNDEVMKLWDMQALSVTSNPAPILRQLALSILKGLRQIPSVVLQNLSSLRLDYFEDDAIFSSSDLGEKEGFVLIYSQLPNLEELKVNNSQLLKELFEKEDCNVIVDTLTLFCRQVKTLELNTLPSLNLIPLHLFKSIASLTLFELKWSYLISAHVLEDSLHQLQFLSIEKCDNMESLVINVGLHIKLLSLKQLCLLYLTRFIGISSLPKDEATLFLPSLESLEIKCCGDLKTFWSGSIVAPRLEDLSLGNCDNLEQFLVGNVEDTMELPSLQKLSFSGCRNVKFISSGSLTAPKLRQLDLTYCNNMQCLSPGNPINDGDLQLSSLESVYIYSCPNLHALSQRRVLAPKLTQITYQGNQYSMLPFDDLNQFLQKTNPISNSKDHEDFDKDDEDTNGD